MNALNPIRTHHPQHREGLTFLSSTSLTSGSTGFPTNLPYLQFPSASLAFAWPLIASVHPEDTYLRLSLAAVRTDYLPDLAQSRNLLRSVKIRLQD